MKEITAEIRYNVYYEYDLVSHTYREIPQNEIESIKINCAVDNIAVSQAVLTFSDGARGRYCYVSCVSTKKEFRRHGYASAVMRFAELICRQRGVKEIRLRATEEGKLLYRTIGYVADDPVEER